MENRMTIHRALAELKLIDSRITKGISTIEPVGAMQDGKLVNGFYPREDFDKNVKSGIQSIQDLITRKYQIKSAITKANGTTIVNISGSEMTISDAINYKTIIAFKKELILQLTRKVSATKSNVEKNNAQVEANALGLANAALGKDNVKINDTDALSVTEPYLKKNLFSLVDPMKVEELIVNLQNEVDKFEVEVDAVLSEINAITLIEF